MGPLTVSKTEAHQMPIKFFSTHRSFAEGVIGESVRGESVRTDGIEIEEQFSGRTERDIQQQPTDQQRTPYD